MSSRTREYTYIAWREEGIWTAHSPSIPGVYGLGDTKKKAERDLFDAVDTLFDYLHEIGEKPPMERRLVIGAMRVDV